MADEDVGEIEPLLKLGEKVEDLRADGLVERRNGLVENDKLGLEREGAGDVDALALPARKLMRIAIGVLRGLESDRVEEFLGSCSRLQPPASPGACAARRRLNR